jgi:hypothetical protein
MQRAVGEQILSRQDKYAARVEMQVCAHEPPVLRRTNLGHKMTQLFRLNCKSADAQQPWADQVFGASFEFAVYRRPRPAAPPAADPLRGASTQAAEETGVVWEEAGRRVWAPSPPGSSPRSRPSSSASSTVRSACDSPRVASLLVGQEADRLVGEKPLGNWTTKRQVVPADARLGQRPKSKEGHGRLADHARRI